jgi:hypothetical protein
MSLLDAVKAVGPIALMDATQAQKKRYSELLSHHLAQEVAAGMREAGFPSVKPVRGEAGEKAFQGGLGPKKVDVSFADEQHGLLLAVSIKTICFAPFGKNLKNRFADLCTEAITLHMRFPYSVICALFAFPAESDKDHADQRILSTFRRAAKLLATVSGREDYKGPGEKFENVTLMLFQPLEAGKTSLRPWIKLVDSETGKEYSEAEYFQMLREIYNRRNPHGPIGDPLQENSSE